MPYVPKAERDRREIERLASENAVFAEYKAKWKFYMEAIEGGESFAKTENLHRHVREHEDDYKERVKRLHYDNILEGLVDFFTDFIFSETILRDGGKDNGWYQEFLKNVDKRGHNIEQFMRELSDDYQTFGMMYVVVDAPRKGENIKTRFDEEKAGIRPYWILVRPEEMLDWVVDPFDTFLYAKRVQRISDYVNGEVIEIERYTEWTAADIKVTDVDVTNPHVKRIIRQDTLTNQIGEVPVVPVRFKRSKIHPFMGNSFLRDLAHEAKSIMNLSSLNDEFLYRQCFNILAMEKDESLPFKEQEEGDTGTANALVYPKGAHPPQYITPSAEPAQYIADTMNAIEAKIFRRAAQDFMNELFNGTKASGFSKSQSFSKSVPKIAARADTLERAENELMRLTMKFRRKEWNGAVKYKDRYEITSLTDWMTQLHMLFRDLNFDSPTFFKTQMKKAAAMFDGKFTTDEIAAINAELERIDFKKWLKKVGPQEKVAKPSPTAQQKPKQTGTSAEVAAESKQDGKTGATVKVRKPRNAK